MTKIDEYIRYVRNMGVSSMGFPRDIELVIATMLIPGEMQFPSSFYVFLSQIYPSRAILTFFFYSQCVRASNFLQDVLLLSLAPTPKVLKVLIRLLSTRRTLLSFCKMCKLEESEAKMCFLGRIKIKLLQK